jgi:hypothetical protein
MSAIAAVGWRKSFSRVGDDSNTHTRNQSTDSEETVVSVVTCNTLTLRFR